MCALVCVPCLDYYGVKRTQSVRKTHLSNRKLTAPPQTLTAKIRMKWNLHIVVRFVGAWHSLNIFRNEPSCTFATAFTVSVGHNVFSFKI